MSIYADTQTPSHVRGLVNAVAGIVVARVRASRPDAQKSPRRRHPGGLDDRMLADIGLTRGDVRDAFSEPVWRDPTAFW